MSRATSLLPRLTLLALALTSGCAFPFFRSKDNSLEEMVTVEALSEEGPRTPAIEPEPTVAANEKPLPPIARFFGGLFGRGKSKPEAEADPISTIPTPAKPQSESVSTTSEPKIEYNNTGDIGAGVIASKSKTPTPAAPQISNLAEMSPEAKTSPTTPAPKPAVAQKKEPTETVNPYAVAEAPQEKPALQKQATMPNPAKPTFATQSERPPSGSLTSALRNALDEATKDGLAQESPQREPQSIAAQLSSAPTTSRYALASPTPTPTPTPTTPAPTQSQIVNLHSSPIDATPPTPTRAQPAPATSNPAAITEQSSPTPAATNPQIVTAAQQSSGNPLREESATSQTRMIDLAAHPIGARTEKPQTVYPTQETTPETKPVVETAAKPADATTLVAFQSHVHAGDSIIDQMKQSRRINQFRPMYDSTKNAPTADTAQSAGSSATQTSEPEPAPAERSEMQARPTVVAATPTQPSVARESQTLAAAQTSPAPVELYIPKHGPTPQQSSDFAATIPLKNPATALPAMSNPEPVNPPVRSETLSQLVPSDLPVASAVLEQPGSQPVELAQQPIAAVPPRQLAASTPTNPVRAVPRVAVAPQTSASSTTSPASPPRPTPQLATRPTPAPTTAAIEPLVVPTPPRASAPYISPVATPQLAPVVSIEEYRRMQQERRNGTTRRY